MPQPHPHVRRDRRHRRVLRLGPVARRHRPVAGRQRRPLVRMKFWLGVAFAEPDDLFDLARAADESGWHGITVSDHIVYLRDLSTPYPYTPDGRPGWQPETSWPDPWVTIGALAATTTRLQFTTNVFVAPLRDT